MVNYALAFLLAVTLSTLLLLLLTQLDKTPKSNVIPSFSVVFIVCPNWKNHRGFVILSNTVGILDEKSPVELDKTPGSQIYFGIFLLVDHIFEVRAHIFSSCDEFVRKTVISLTLT